MKKEESATALPMRRDDCDLLYDALRLARDEFLDEHRLCWSNAEYARLHEIIEALEPLIEANRARG